MSVEAWRSIKEPFTHPFTVQKTGLHSISITATCQSGEQINQDGGEDLRLEIDGIALREISPVARTQTYNIPPTWNGTQLQGKAKTIIFILSLPAGSHELKFFPYRGADIIIKPKVEALPNPQAIAFPIRETAERGDRWPWYAFALLNLPLKTFTIDATIHGRLGDSDDLKIIVDGKAKENPNSKKHRFWYWAGSIFRKFSSRIHQQETFTENLEKRDHYIEIWADEEPILHKVELDLGSLPPPEPVKPAKRIPTVEDPAWTKDFKDDTEQMILTRAIFGEARDKRLSDQVRIGVAWSIRRRVEDSRDRWGKTYNTVITQPEQYSAFNEDETDNRPYVENPL